MVHDLSQDTAPPTNSSAKGGAPAPRQAIAGVMAPQLDEAMIREVWPSVVAYKGGHAAAWLTTSGFGIPVGLPMLGYLLARKFLPFVCKRYTLTNRRLMIRRGLKPSPAQGVALSEIDDVRLLPGSLHPFYRSADLEVLSKGQVALRLPGVPDPESFRHSILNAVKAWVPDKAKGPWLAANAPVKA
jgi:hypothetical protein